MMRGDLSYVMPHEQWYDAARTASIIVTFRDYGYADDFTIVFNETPPGGGRGPQVEMNLWGASWPALGRMSDLFTDLANIEPTLSAVRNLLDESGAKDRTNRNGNGPYSESLKAAREFMGNTSRHNAQELVAELQKFIDTEDQPPF